MTILALLEMATAITIINTLSIIPPSLKIMTNPPRRGIINTGTTSNIHLVEGKKDLPSNIMGRILPDNRLDKRTDAAIKPEIINITENKKTIPRHKYSFRPISKKISN